MFSDFDDDESLDDEANFAAFQAATESSAFVKAMTALSAATVMATAATLLATCVLVVMGMWRDVSREEGE